MDVAPRTRVGRHDRLARACLLALTLASLLACMTGARAEGPPSIAPVLTPLVKTLTRDVYTYHYAMRVRLGLGPTGYVAPDHPGRDEYIRMKIARFWDLSIPTAPYATASGLYVGADPVISRAFGGVGEDVWAMVQVVLPKGFRVIDVRRWNDGRQAQQRFPPGLAEQLRAAGCAVDFPEALLIGLEHPACRSMAVRTLRELGVDAILYTFQSFRFTECPARPAGGFIVLNGAPLQTARMRLLTSAARHDGAVDDRQIVHELFARARRAGSRRELPWPALAGRRLPVSIEPWMRQHLFGCGAYAEDAMPPDLSPATTAAARR